MSMLVSLMGGLVVASSLAAGRNVSNEELWHEKHGQIVDASTGAGIAGARVIAMWRRFGVSLSGAGGGCALQKFATTDANGRYVIPDVTKELDLSPRHPESQALMLTINSSWVDFKWGIVVYLPGYIREGDAEVFQRLPLSTKPTPIPGSHYLHSPGPRVYFNWLYFQIPSQIVGNTVQVEPIRMVKTQLDPQQQIVYDYWITRGINNCYAFGGSESTGFRNIKPAGLKDIENDMRRRIRDLPCTLPASTLVGGVVVDDYTYLLADDALDQRLIDGGFANSGCSPCHKDMDAGTLCRAETGNGRENENP